MEKTGISMEEAVPVLRLLGDRTRLSIVLMLFHKACCVCELVETLNMSQPAISQHLRKLRDAKIVLEDRRGQWIYYSLHKKMEFYPLVERILDFVPEQEGVRKKLKEAQRNNCC